MRALHFWCVLVGVLAVGVAHAETPVFGNVTQSQTWTAGGSPYVLQNAVVVVDGVTLTLEPGTTVRMKSGLASTSLFDVEGTLVADASAGAPIVFDREGASSEGAWGGVRIAAGGGATLKNVEIHWARTGLELQSSTADKVVVDGLTVTEFNTRGILLTGSSNNVALKNVTVLDGETGQADPGIHLDGTASATHSLLTIVGCTEGVRVTDSSSTIESALIRGCTERALYVHKPSSTSRSVAVVGSTLYGNGNAAVTLYDAHSSGTLKLTFKDSVSLQHTRTFESAGSSNYNYFPTVDYDWSVLSDTSLEGAYLYVDQPQGHGQRLDPLLADPAAGDFTPTTRSPLRNSASDGGTIGRYPYDEATAIPTPGYHGVWWESGSIADGATLQGDIRVPVGSTLTIAPGATLLVQAISDVMKGGVSASKVELVVEGTLSALGTAAAPILISATSSSKTAWYGLRATSSATLDVGGLTVTNAERALWLDDTDAAPASFSARSSSYGVWVDGGDPPLQNLTLEDNSTGLRMVQTDADVQNLWISGSSSRGVHIESNGKIHVIEACRIVDGATDAIFVNKTSSSNVVVTLDHCTVAYNAGDAIDTHDEHQSGSLTIAVKGSVISHNGGNAFASSGSSNYNYFPTYNWERSNVWGNKALTGSYVYANAKVGALEYNPLYVNGEERDLRPTHRSPLRYSDGADGTIGYEPYEGDQTPGFMGFYWENFQFPTGEHVIAGDIVITSRKIPGTGADPVDPQDDVPARITVVPGTTLKFQTTDAMGGKGFPDGDSQRIEIVNHGILEMDGISFLPIQLASATGASRTSWYGVVVASDAHGTNVSEVVIRHARYGVRVVGSDHIVKNLEILECDHGVWVDGGSPEVKSVLVHDSNHGIVLMDSASTLTDITAHHCKYDGLEVEANGKAISVDRCLLYENGRHGVRAVKTSSATVTLKLERCTIHANQKDGLNLDDDHQSGSLNVDLRSSAVTSNEEYAFRSVGSSNYNYFPTVSYRHSDIWDNQVGLSNTYLYLDDVANTGNLSYNPLYKDPGSGDFTPTRRSPLRCLHSNAKDAAGYGDYAGDPTGTLVGFLHEDMTLDAAGSPYELPGDLVVTSHCSVDPVVLTIEPGAVLQFAAKADLMGGGHQADRGELRVVDDLVIDGGTAQVSLVSSAEGNAAKKGDWTGVRLDEGSTALMDGFLIANATDGIRGVTAPGNVYANGVIRDGSGYGINLHGGEGGSIEGMLVANNTGIGVFVQDVEGTPEVLGSIVIDHNHALRVLNSHILVVNNVLMGTGSGGRGFWAERDTGSTNRVWTLYNNTIHEHGGDCVYLRNGHTSGNVTFTARNNLLTHCGGYAFRDASPNTSYVVNESLDYNNWFETKLEGGASHHKMNKGAHSTSFDPRYEDIDPGGQRRWYDLRLLNDSPLIDAGTTTPVADDLLGVERPQLTKFDIGAYEYDPNANHDPWAAAGEDVLVAMLDVSCFTAAPDTIDPDGDAMLYEWSFGDGGNATGSFVCHTFTDNTIHEVILTVTDVHGGVDHDVLLADVNHRPIAEAGPEVYAAAGGDKAEFDGQQSHDPDGTVVAYSWDFGDGVGTSTDPAPSYQYPPGGTQDFLVTLTVTDNDGHTNTDTTIAHVIGTSDSLGPLLAHSPVTDGRPSGLAIEITATVSDFSGVDHATVYYRTQGDDAFGEVAMANVGGTTYQATIPQDAIEPPVVEYYLSATDGFAPPNVSYHPVGSPDAALHSFTVLAVDNVGPTITHAPIGGGQPEGQPVTVQATVTDPSGLAAVTLHYKVATGSSYGDAPMIDLGDGLYSAAIPGFVVTSAGVDYFITAADTAPASNTSAHPAGAPGTPHTFSVAVDDTEGPQIAHEPIGDGQLDGQAVQVVATITDESDVDFAVLNYRVLGAGSFAAVPMAADGDTYSAEIPAGIVTTAGVEYYVYAQDDSAAHNARLAPATAPAAPYAFTVSSADESGPSIAHTPPADGQPQDVAIPIGAAIVDGSGVASATLYYRAVGTNDWTVVPMTKGAGDQWNGAIAQAAAKAPGLQYYLSAVDDSANSNESTSPVGAPTAFHQFSVVAEDVTGPQVTHTPVLDGQLAGADVVVTATVVDDSGVNSVTLYHRASTPGAEWVVLPMEAGGGAWSATIGGAAVGEAGVDYYIIAVDDSPAANQSAEPAAGADAPHSFTVVPADETGPQVTHTPVGDGQAEGAPVLIAAEVTDASGLAAVVMAYRAPGGSFTELAMSPSVGATFVAEIPAGSVVAPAVEYYLKATDASPAANEATSPAGAPTGVHTFTVAAADETGPQIAHTPVADGQPEGKDVGILADVTDPGGVATVTLLYRPSGSGAFSSVEMTLDAGSWQGAVPGFAVGTGGVDYLIKAVDAAGNVSYHPTSAPGTPHSFSVTPADDAPPALGHTPISGAQEAGLAVDIEASAVDETGVASVTLYYRPVGSGSYSSVDLELVDGTWSAAIPGFAVVVGGVEYYLAAVDSSEAANAATLPAAAPDSVYSFDVFVPDADPPVIAHAAVPNNQPLGVAVPVSAQATDASGVATVSLHYRPVGATFSTTALSQQPSGAWVGEIPSFAVTELGVEYYLSATDTAEPPNTATLPAGAPADVFVFAVTTEDLTGPSIAHSAIGAAAEGDDLLVSAAITDPSVVASATLGYRAPPAVDWTLVAMTQAGATWSATIGGSEVTSAGLEYYLTATDGAGNGSAVPAAAPAAWYPVTVEAKDTVGPAIEHTPVADGQIAGSEVLVAATASDPSGVAAVTLFARPVGAGQFSQLALDSLGGDVWQGAIPGFVVSAPAVEYYLLAEDAAGNTSLHPAAGPAAPHGFVVAPADSEGPVISHAPIAGVQAAGQAVTIAAEVADETGVDGVSLHYRPVGSPSFSTTAMSVVAAGTWSASVPGFAVGAAGVEYYLTALDTADPANGSAHPAGAPDAGVHSFAVASADTAGPSITHAPVPDGQEAGLAVAIAATVEDESGVAEVGLRVRTVGTASWIDVSMTDSGGEWSAEIPGVLVDPVGVEYYLQAVDGAGNGSTAPAEGMSAPYAFTVVAADDDGPALAHTPAADGQLAGAPVSIAVAAVDPSGVASVSLHFRPSGPGAFSAVGMTLAAGSDEWTADIPGFVVAAPGVDYYIASVDASANANPSASPAEAPAFWHSFTVGGVDDSGPTIAHTPLGPQPAGSDAVFNAVVLDPSGVASVTLLAASANDETFTVKAMVAQGDTWSATVAVEAADEEISYYLEAVDTLDNASQLPAAGPDDPYVFDVTVEDESGPQIDVVAVADGQPEGAEVVVEATAADASGVDAVSLHYRASGGAAFKAEPMTALGGGLYQAVIPAAAVVAPGLDYYVRAVDGSAAGNTAFWPALAPGEPAAFTVVADLDELAPAVVAVAVPDGQPAGAAVRVEATATDDVGVAQVILSYAADGASFAQVTMAAAGADGYAADIPAAAASAPGVDYYVEAFDAAGNVGRWPSEGATAHFTVDAPEVDSTPPTITHTPAAGPLEAGEGVAISATITDDSGVAGASLDYRANGGTWKILALIPGAASGSYSATIPGADVLEGTLEYYLSARDSSPAENLAYSPAAAADGPHALTVDPRPPTETGPSAQPSDGGGCASGGPASRSTPWLALVLLLAWILIRARDRFGLVR